jgi:hypothetical protein
MLGRAVTWLIESQMMPQSHPRLKDAIVRAGQASVDWNDEWWGTGDWPGLDGQAVIFHGSLENAARIAEKRQWMPGSFCDVEAFHCSRWYPSASAWLVHERWKLWTAERFVAEADDVQREFGSPRVFVRPDSPLKPFSGRLLSLDQVSLAALDHGFYYNDASLPIIVAPERSIGREWRYVVVRQEVVAGSAYAADGRTALPDDPRGEPWAFAESVARMLELPQDVCVLDVCEVDGRLRLLELNPFSGADLYACDADAVVAAVSDAALQRFQ